MPTDLRFDANEAVLFVDLYELTMAASYFAIGYNDATCFSVTIRRGATFWSWPGWNGYSRCWRSCAYRKLRSERNGDAALLKPELPRRSLWIGRGGRLACPYLRRDASGLRCSRSHTP